MPTLEVDLFIVPREDQEVEVPRRLGIGRVVDPLEPLEMWVLLARGCDRFPGESIVGLLLGVGGGLEALASAR